MNEVGDFKVKREPVYWDLWLVGYVLWNVAIYIVCEVTGCKSVLVQECLSIQEVCLFQGFIHLNTLHLLLNMVAFAALFASLRRYVSSWKILCMSGLMVVLAGWLTVAQTPVWGASGWISVLLGMDCARRLFEGRFRRYVEDGLFVLFVVTGLLVISFFSLAQAYYHGIAFMLGGVSVWLRRLLFRYVILLLLLLFCSACGSVKRREAAKLVSERAVTEERTDSVYSSFRNDWQVMVSDCSAWEAVKVEYDTSSVFSTDNERRIRSTLYVKGYRNRESTTVGQEDRERVRHQEVELSVNDQKLVERQEESERRKDGAFWWWIVLLPVVAIGVYVLKKFYK